MLAELELAGIEQAHVRVGEALMKSRKSCACATAADVPFEAILKGVVVEYDRIGTMDILWQLRRKIAEGFAIIEGAERVMGCGAPCSCLTKVRWGSCLELR